MSNWFFHRNLQIHYFPPHLHSLRLCSSPCCITPQFFSILIVCLPDHLRILISRVFHNWCCYSSNFPFKASYKEMKKMKILSSHYLSQFTYLCPHRKKPKHITVTYHTPVQTLPISQVLSLRWHYMSWVILLNYFFLFFP